jgi:hypothetical protein
MAWVLAAGIAAQVAFALNYYVPNTFVYYLPAYVWLAVCVALAIDAALNAILGREVARRGPEKTPMGGAGKAGRSAVPIRAHLALAFLVLASAWPIHLLSTRWQGMDQGQAYVRLPFDYGYGQLAAWYTEPDALLVSDWLPATVLWYTQWVEGQMPRAQVMVVDPLEGQWRGHIDGALAQGRPVYLARPLMSAGDSHSLTAAGPMVRVLDRPLLVAPAMSHPMVRPAARGGAIQLLGSDWVVAAPGAEGKVYALSSPDDAPAQVAGGSIVHVTVYWQAERVPAGDYGVTVRLVDAAGQPWLERQNRHPVGGTYPTSRWVAGEVVGDYYRLALPEYLPSGEYQVRATTDAWTPEETATGMSSGVLLGTLLVRKPLRWQNPIVGVPARQVFHSKEGSVPALVMVGYEAPGEWIPEEAVSISLQWLVCSQRRSGQSGRQRISLEDRPRPVLVTHDGTETPLKADAIAAGSTYRSGEIGRLDDWRPGALLVDPYRFTVPGDLAYVEVQRSDELGDPTKAHGLERGGRYRLPVPVAPASSRGTNFGDVVRLREYSYVDGNAGTYSYRPGDTVRLTLEWQAMKQMDEAYKVFVHVLGPNGLPVAQQDNEPVNGTYPTTRWRPGERVSDPYAVRLPGDLVPGEYPVEIGLYRISDLSRLPVLDQAQTMVDDKLFLTPLTVE